MAQNQDGKQKVRLAGIGTCIHEKGFGYYMSDRDPVPTLPVESQCMPPDGMEGVCRAVIGCPQPNG